MPGCSVPLIDVLQAQSSMGLIQVEKSSTPKPAGTSSGSASRRQPRRPRGHLRSTISPGQAYFGHNRHHRPRNIVDLSTGVTVKPWCRWTVREGAPGKPTGGIRKSICSPNTKSTTIPWSAAGVTSESFWPPQSRRQCEFYVHVAAIYLVICSRPRFQDLLKHMNFPE